MMAYRYSLLVLWLQLDRALLLSSNDPNVCSYWESFTTVSKESFVQPFVQESKEPCKSLAWLRAKTCPQYRVLYKTAYRQGVRVDYRRRHHCCEGFYESSDACVPRCAQECVHGRCVAPEQCQCEQGWRGSDCSSECSDQSWGPNCQSPCTCLNGGSCDPLTGACTCPPGYHGQECQEPCATGTYGQGCQLDCHCQNGASCSLVNGACLCSPGYAGPHCETLCPNSTHGFQCAAFCPCQNGGVCHLPSSSKCACPSGWTGDICSTRCPVGHFGFSCQEECRCHNGGQCDPDSGQCRCAPGYLGEECREKCPIGKYGQDCRETCDCTNGGHCFHISGGCLCEAGFYGSHCEERKCLPGLYGLSCQFPCLCDPQHTQSCHPISGECACKAGWAGLYCNETCPHGSHGLRCQEPCLCLNGGTCDGETGRCSCPPGYADKHCSSPCPDDTFGVNCSQGCSCQNALGCSPVDGTCFCKEGRTCVPRWSTWRGGPSFRGGDKRQGWAMPSFVNPNGLCERRKDPDPSHQLLPMRSPSCDPPPLCLFSSPPGWQGVDCSAPCSAGTWGAGCNQTCLCANGATCEPMDGGCTCLAGWQGSQCTQPCPGWFYGLGCGRKCSCENAAGCDPVSGRCHCLPGWKGPRCSQPCAEGLWGEQCRQMCSCKNGASCSPKDGICECAPGFRGPNCQRRCASGFFGNNCTSRCQCQHGGLCDPGTGSCSCPSGYTGAHCRPDHPLTMVPALPAANPSLGAVIGIIILAALLAAVLVLFFCYRRCQKEKEKRHVSVAYTTGRTDSSEYVVPDVPPNYTHYYSNPSYHTLSPCTPTFAIPSSSDQPDWSGLPGADCNATLPSDWKHRRGSLAHGQCLPWRGAGLGRERKGPWGHSDSSLSSENPYATIKDCPGPAGKVPEGSYMEMKCPPPSKREISLFEEPSCSSQTKEEDGSGEGGEGWVAPSLCRVSQGTPAVPPNHYDSPKNSHIPSHYDVPPVRHYPPSPPLRRQAR
uniref:Platelet endothelial aggregation receptor 1 n=1 Tax=Pseudonaja textilis TaxID=8673 RepID=A0A670YKS9_PSETE